MAFLRARRGFFSAATPASDRRAICWAPSSRRAAEMNWPTWAGGPRTAASGPVVPPSADRRLPLRTSVLPERALRLHDPADIPHRV
jgi:hypothetical protein